MATLTVMFDPVACTPVAPVEPTVTQATCTAGAVRPPTIELVPAAGVIYSFDPTDLGDGTEDVPVTVTATLADGFGVGSAARRGCRTIRRRRR